MDPFFMYVSIGALVLLILILTIIGVAMTQAQASVPFPPTQNTCPDYWDVSSNPNYCGVPLNGLKNIGYIELKSDNSQIDPANKINIGMCKGSGFGCAPASAGSYLNSVTSSSDPLNKTSQYQYVQLNNNSTGWGSFYPGTSERCAQKKWASTLNVSWDGVTNYNGC